MQVIEELEKALEHLERAREAEPLFQPYQDDPYLCLRLGRAILIVRDLPGRLKFYKNRQEKEE